MKNILYLGPYRQDTHNGLLSRQLIENISKKYPNIVIRPIYPENANNIPIGSIQNLEDNRCDRYDTIVQHAPIHTLTSIAGIKNNIAIPILDNIVCNNRNIQILSRFTKILLANHLDYNELAKHTKLKNKISKYDFDITLPEKKAKINIGLYDQFAKIYAVIPNNKDTILNIVTAFNLVSSTWTQKYVLLLFIDNLTPENKNQLDTNINNLCQNMGITNNKKIITFKSEFDIHTLFAIHSSGNIYLPDNGSVVSNKIAELSNTNIVTYDVNSYEISLFNNGNYYPDGIHVLTANSIKNYLFNNNSNYKKTHTKITHINNLI